MIKADANDIPLDDDSMDCILTFNAIHHFDFVNFIEKPNKVIKENADVIALFSIGTIRYDPIAGWIVK
jgi:ubiquinone/menaquinone biosynthesis C-methylase UbiE